MQPVNTPYKKGPQGQARVVFGKKLVTVTLKDTQQQFSFEPGAIKSELPAKPVNGDYNVRIGFDLSTLYSIQPWNATVVTEFIGFAAPENQPPVPKFPSNRVGMTKAGVPYEKNYLQMTALLRVIEPDTLEGMIVPVVLRYNFVASPDGSTGIGFTRSKYTEFLMSFLDKASGDITTLNLPFSDNVLPALQAELLKRKRQFQTVVEKGYAVAFGEAMPKRAPKSAKKSAKK